MKSRTLPVQSILTDEDKLALKKLRDEELSRTTPEGRAEQAKIAAEERLIMSYVLYGNKEEIKRLIEAYEDPLTRPITKNLIKKCLDNSGQYHQRGEIDFPSMRGVK